MSSFSSAPTLVGAEGQTSAKIALIGEALGTQEVRLRRPFVGPAGQLLDECLKSAGLSRRELYITNVIKEQPFRNEVEHFIDLSKKIPRITPEAYAYIEALREEISALDANILVALGNVPLFVLTGHTQITKRRGSVYPCSLVPGKKVLACIHPSAALRQYLFKYPIIRDLKRASFEKDFPELRDEDVLIRIEPDYLETLGFLHEILANETSTTLDIEVLNEEVSCISLGNSNLGYLCIPFVGDDGDYFSPEQETEVWYLIAQICEHPLIRILGQNLTFDATFLFRRFGILTRNLDDTMIAQAISYPDLPKGLDFITSIYTRIPYYKDEGKKWFKLGGSWQDFYTYNVKDSAVLDISYAAQFKELQRQRNLDAYRRQVNLIEPLIYMSERGIRVDTGPLAEASASADQKIKDLTSELHDLCGFEINPASPKQLKEYFYETCKYRPYTNRKTGGVSTDRDALKRLSRKGDKVAPLILKIRSLSKLKGTYLDIQLDPDSRLRCAFNPVGTTSGRLSSSQTIFGTGGNMQNLPLEFRQYLLFDEGFLGYQIDLSQAENRVVAYIAPDPLMQDAFESGIDIHRLTASLIFAKDYDEISDEPGSCPIGGGIYSERFWGKKANHGLNYDLGYKTFAFYYEIPESEARLIVEGYHRAYPGVKGYHSWIRNQLAKNRTLGNTFGRNRLFLDRWGDGLWKEAYSFIPQSSVAEQLNLLGVCPIYYDLEKYEHVDLLNQVHDSVWFQIPLTLPLETHAEIVWNLKQSLETPLVWRAKEFKIPADVECSPPGGNIGKFIPPHDDDPGNPRGLMKCKAKTKEDLLKEIQEIAER